MLTYYVSYPVILSLEVHCGIEGQQHMARLVREVLGEVPKNFFSSFSTPCVKAGMIPAQPAVTGVLPPPEELKRKVLLKAS
jgi:hypothetical protein